MPADACESFESMSHCLSAVFVLIGEFKPNHVVLFFFVVSHRLKMKKTVEITTITTSTAATARVTGRTQTQMSRYSFFVQSNSDYYCYEEDDFFKLKANFFDRMTMR